MEKYAVLTYRSYKDFKYKGWTHEHKDNGECIIFGILRKNGKRSKFQKVYRITDNG